MSLKIYSYPQNPRVFRALIAGKYNGLEIETTPDFQMGKDNKTKEFLALNPNGKVPVLVTDDGAIFETNAIARYVAHANPATQLFGSNAYESGLVEQWVDWTNGELDLPAAAWIYPILGFVPNNEQATTKAKGEIRKALALLNTHLLSRTFLVGERVTLADIVVSMSLLPLYRIVFDATFRKPFVNVNRWFLTCINQPQFKAVLGTVDLCVTAQVAPVGVAAAAAPEPEKPKAKAEKKPKVAAAAAADDDEEAEKPKPKAKNPLDSLPPTPFVLDEWKRFYSNAESTKNDAMPWFWEHYDPAGWSLWLSDYKHNEENTVLFQTCNLAGGYCQRLEELRKYGFGAILILGDKSPYEISCCWLVRGQEIPPELSTCPDSELYTFTRVDHTNPAQRELVEDFWAWEGKFVGHPSNVVTDGKTFK